MEPFPFIVGCERSGTTLLRAMFDTHPQMAVPYESPFIVRLAGKRTRYENGSFDREAFLRDLFSNGKFRRWGLDREEIARAVAAAPITEFADAVRVVYREFARRAGKVRYGDKNPDYVMSIPLLAKLFPEARFIHIVRDGRDVACSLLEVRWGPRTFAEAALLWRDRVDAGRRAGRGLGPARYMEVRYEDLVASPEAALPPLCVVAGIDYEPRMLSYFERADDVLRSNFFPEEHRKLHSPVARGVRDWRRALATEDVVLFEQVAGELLDAYGYERSNVTATARLRRRVRRRVLTARAGINVRRVRWLGKKLRTRTSTSGRSERQVREAVAKAAIQEAGLGEGERP